MTDADFATSFGRCSSLGPDWPALSVCIADSGGGQRHVGICMRRGPSFTAMHLSWHNTLMKEPLLPEAWFGCMKTRLPEARQRQVIARALLIHESNGRYVPYGFNLPEGAFDDQTGSVKMGPAGHGLTCATFVLAVFESAGIRLLSYDQWPVREDDNRWRQHVLGLLARSRSADSRAHASAIEADENAIRFRPEEVAAGAGLFPPTADFETANTVGLKILQAMQG